MSIKLEAAEILCMRFCEMVVIISADTLRYNQNMSKHLDKMHKWARSISLIELWSTPRKI